MCLEAYVRTFLTTGVCWSIILATFRITARSKEPRGGVRSARDRMRCSLNLPLVYAIKSIPDQLRLLRRDAGVRAAVKPRTYAFRLTTGCHFSYRGSRVNPSAEKFFPWPVRHGRVMSVSKCLLYPPNRKRCPLNHVARPLMGCVNRTVNN